MHVVNDQRLTGHHRPAGETGAAGEAGSGEVVLPFARDGFEDQLAGSSSRKIDAAAAPKTPRATSTIDCSKLR